MTYLDQLQEINKELALALAEKSTLLNRFNETQRIAKLGNWEWDIKAGTVWWSEEVYRIFELNPDTYIPSFEENATYVHPDDYDQYIKDVTDSFKSGEMLDIDLRIVTPTGKIKNCCLAGKIYFDEKGEPSRYAGTFSDVTERKQAQNNILELERRFRYVMNGVSLLSMILDNKGNITFCSDYLLKITGYECSEVIGKNWFDIFIPAENRGLINELFQDLMIHGNFLPSYENEILTRHGEKLLISWNNTVLCAVSGEITGTASIGENITQKRNDEEKLRLSEERLRFSLEGANDGVWEVNLADNSFYMSPRGCEILGFTPEEIPGVAKTWMDFVHPDDVQDSFDTLNKYLQDANSVFQIEQRLKTKSGEWKWILARGKVVARSTDGSPLKMTGTHTDITERKIAEEALKANQTALKEQIEEYQVLNEELSERNRRITEMNADLLAAKESAQESDRLKTLFLQNMSHEIRTPMNAIIGFSELIPQYFHDKDKLASYTNIIQQRSKDLLDLIDGILDLSRIESGQQRIYTDKCDLNQLFCDLHSFFLQEIKKKGKGAVKLVFHNIEPPVLSSIITDSGKLKQILINLINNAIKFTNEGQIEIGCTPESKNMLKFYVKDTGVGFPEEKKEIIFDRFIQLNNSSNNPQGGTGLGLAIVKGLVEMLGGEIQADSAPLVGSTFTFTIAANHTMATDEIKTEQHQAKIDILLAGTLLIVEDDIHSAELIKAILSPSNLTLHHVTSGEQVFSFFENNDADIVLMDLRLPVMNGFEITKKLKQRRPDIKVIAQTAYAMNEDRQKALDAGCDDFISKPINRSHLLVKINELLTELHHSKKRT